MVTGSNKGERVGYRDVRKVGEFNTGCVLGGIHSIGLDVDNNVPDTKG